VVENVRGAQKWVGRARWNFGSFYLWGDVPALMPIVRPRAKRPGHDWNRFNETGEVSPHWRLDGQETEGRKTEGRKTEGLVNIRDGHSHTRHLTNQREHDAIKNNGGSWFNVAHNTTSGKGQNPDGRKHKDADGYDRAHPDAFGWKATRTSSHSPARKAASAMIAKIPFELARHVAQSWKPIAV
jgi:hypothetical protein